MYFPIFYHYTRGIQVYLWTIFLQICTFNKSFNYSRAKSLFNNNLIFLLLIKLIQIYIIRVLKGLFAIIFHSFLLVQIDKQSKKIFFSFSVKKNTYFKMNWKKYFIDLTSLEGLFIIFLEWLAFKRDGIVIHCDWIQLNMLQIYGENVKAFVHWKNESVHVAKGELR